jgi:AraC-like DNA-binding protein
MNDIKKMRGFENEQYFIIPDEFLARYAKNPYFHFMTVKNVGYFPHAKYHYVEHEAPKSIIVNYCVAGSGCYSIDGGEIHNVSAGQLVVFPSGKPHLYAASNDDPWSHFFISGMGDVFSYIDKMAPFGLTVDIPVSYGERIQELFRQCFSILRMPYQIEEYVYVCQMAATILSMIPCTAKQSSRQLSTNGSRGLERAIVFMKNKLYEKLTRDQIARAAFLSPSHLDHIFKQFTGYAPMEYFLRLKIQAAAKDIFFSASHIRDIAGIYGIEDPYYFSRLFKRIMGVSPQQYRNYNRQYLQVPPE